MLNFHRFIEHQIDNTEESVHVCEHCVKDGEVPEYMEQIDVVYDDVGDLECHICGTYFDHEEYNYMI